MRFAVSCPNAGDPARLVALAQDSERAGWDGFFVWDHLHLVRAMALDLHDPWVLLGAVAHATQRLRIGALVTPVARRRPWKLAKEIVTLDHLSGGRVTVGVGLGWPDDDDFGAFGEPAAPAARAAVYDEGLDLLDRLLRGGPVRSAGPTYAIDVDLHPGPVQRPRPPVWVAAMSAGRPLARAARYDGVALASGDGEPVTPDDVARLVAALPAHGHPFDVIVPWAPAHAPVRYYEAGATWLVAGCWPEDDWFDGLEAWARRGPGA